MKTAVATFAYPAPSIEAYARECLDSLARQSDRDFSLFVFNDGLESMPDIVSQSEMTAEIVPVCGTPAAIRQLAIRHLIACGVELIVFADIDDIFDSQRIATVKKMIAAGSDIVVNELILFGESVLQPYRMFEGRLEEGAALNEIDIRHGNCCGMSNTAIRASVIPARALEACDVIAFDWYFYACILSTGVSATYTQKTHTAYRRHANNIAAVRALSDSDIVRGLDVKYRHCNALGRSCAEELAETASVIATNELQKQRYCSAVRAAMPAQPFWWESIKTFGELGL